MPILLVSGVDGSRQVFVGPDERAYRRAFGAFVESWGEEAVWFDEHARVLGCDGGVTMARWRARRLGRAPMFGLVVLVGSQAADVYLVDDADMASQVMVALEQPGIDFQLVPLEVLSSTGTGPGDSLAGLPAIRLASPSAGRPLGPRAPFSDKLCDRCQDHPLYEEPLFDATFGDGVRVCVACGTFASLGRPS